jgi:EpsI family protein
VTVAIDGTPVDAAQVRLLAHDKGRLVWNWYWVDGRFTADGRLAKLLQLKAALTGSSQAMAIVAIAADYRETPDEARATLDEFVADLGPLGPWLASVAP